MSYLETLRSASFRGVPFLVDSAEVEGGRRVDVYEIGERVQTADLGVAAGRYPITGYLDGADALAQWARLEAALRVGQGPLVHPAFGEFDGQIISYRGGISRSRQGRVEFDLVAIRRVQEPPAPTIDVESVMAAATAAATDALAVDFAESFSLDGPANLLDDAEAVLLEVLDALSTPAEVVADAREFVARVAAIRDDARSLLQLPEELASALAGLWADIIDLVALDAATADAGAEPEDSTGYTPIEAQRAANGDAIRGLVTRSSIVAAVGAVADWSWTSWDQLIAYRDTYVDRMQAEDLVIGPAAFAAWQDLRAAFLDAVAATAEELVPTQDVVPVDGESAIVLAHRLYGDAERAMEIATRNRVDDPGSLPASTLRVLSQ